MMKQKMTSHEEENYEEDNIGDTKTEVDFKDEKSELDSGEDDTAENEEDHDRDQDASHDEETNSENKGSELDESKKQMIAKKQRQILMIQTIKRVGQAVKGLMTVMKVIKKS